MIDGRPILSDRERSDRSARTVNSADLLIDWHDAWPIPESGVEINRRREGAYSIETVRHYAISSRYTTAIRNNYVMQLE